MYARVCSRVGRVLISGGVPVAEFVGGPIVFTRPRVWIESVNDGHNFPELFVHVLAVFLAITKQQRTKRSESGRRVVQVQPTIQLSLPSIPL